jgi:hypothetical protein
MQNLLFLFFEETNINRIIIEFVINCSKLKNGRK